MRISAQLLFLTLTASAAVAQDFVPPTSYPAERYETEWRRNPFTLKTAPVALQKESFAKDLVLGGITKIGDTTKVVLVNTKTRERTTIREDATGPDGITLCEVHLSELRKESFVRIALGADTAELRYDEVFLKQLAASGAVAAQKNNAPTKVAVQNGTVVLPVLPQTVPSSKAAPAESTALNAGSSPGLIPPLPTPATTPLANNNIPTPERRRRATAPVPPAR